MCSYEEKLKELKQTGAVRMEQDGMLRKEVKLEINKIQRNMQKQFQMEFQNFLKKIDIKGEERRLIRYVNIISSFFITGLESFFRFHYLM